MQTAHRDLWCLISNQYQPFVIRVPPTGYIYDLKELILPKCKMIDLDHNTILLMKVRIAQAS